MEKKKNTPPHFGKVTLVYFTVVDVLLFAQLPACQLEQGWRELADMRSWHTGVENFGVYQKETPATIEWLRMGDGHGRKTLFSRRYSLPAKVVLLVCCAVVTRLSWPEGSFNSWDAPEFWSPRKNPPSQLSCHVRFVPPLTGSLCPGRVWAICSNALISVLPKKREPLWAFLKRSHKLTHGLCTHTHTQVLHVQTLMIRDIHLEELLVQWT